MLLLMMMMTAMNPGIVGLIQGSLSLLVDAVLLTLKLLSTLCIQGVDISKGGGDIAGGGSGSSVEIVASSDGGGGAPVIIVHTTATTVGRYG